MKELSLNQLFFPENGDEPTANLINNVEEGDSVLEALRRDLKKQLPKLSFATVAEEMEAVIGQALDVGLEEVFGSAWTKYKGFQDYADPEKYPPEEIILVPLATHTVQSSHAPHVDLLVKNVEIGSIRLEVELTLEMEAVVLKVQGGRIREIRSGSCQASGSLKCSLASRIGTRDLLSLERKTPKFELAAFDLGVGIEIPVVQAPDLSEYADSVASSIEAARDVRTS